MRLFKPSYTKNGESRTSDVWNVEVWIGGLRHRKSTGCRDKRAAEEKAREIRLKLERKAAGLTSQEEEHAEKPLEESLLGFLVSLDAKKVVPRHRNDREACLRAFVAATGAKTIRDLDGAKAEAWLVEVAETGLSARSVNRRRDALRAFGRWLVRVRRVTGNPFAFLPGRNEAADRRRVRRALSDADFGKLVDAARRRPLADATRPRRIRKSVSSPRISPEEEERLRALGVERALVYAFASRTGLRRGELGRLTWGDLDLERGIVRVPATSAKAKKEQRAALRGGLALALAARRGSAPPTALVFGPDAIPSVPVLKRDLAFAGLPFRDAEGFVADLHALRGTLVTGLVANGESPSTVQAVARHASVTTTMGSYLDRRALDLVAAVERLPSVPEEENLFATLTGATPSTSGAVDGLGGGLGGDLAPSTVQPALARTTEEGQNRPLETVSAGPSVGPAEPCEVLRAVGHDPTTNSLKDQPGDSQSVSYQGATSSPPGAWAPAWGASVHDPAPSPEALARELLRLAADAPDPAPLLAAAQALLASARPAPPSTAPTSSPAPDATAPAPEPLRLLRGGA